MSNVIDILHDDYEKIFGVYMKERGTRLIYQGREYIAVNDNDHIKFVETVPSNNFDAGYGKQSFREV